MKKINRKLIIISSLLIAASFTLFSFTIRWGGDSFTIHLNDKLLIKQFVYGDKNIKSIELKQNNAEDELRISYSHCGVVGKSKTITVKDQHDKVLKSWTFSDGQASMTCKVKDILGLEKGDVSLRLFYSSKEMPGGLVLASIKTDSRSTVRK